MLVCEAGLKKIKKNKSQRFTTALNRRKSGKYPPNVTSGLTMQQWGPNTVLCKSQAEDDHDGKLQFGGETSGSDVEKITN